MKKDNSVIAKISVLLVSLVMILVIFHLPMGTSSAEEDSDAVEAPDWNEGDEWTYEAVYGTDEEDTAEFTERIKSTDVSIDPELQEDDVSYDETYHLVREGERKLHRYYEKSSLSLVFENPEESAASFYNPPRKDLNFPFEVGDEWREITEEYVGSVEDSGDFEHQKSWIIDGKVERNQMFSLGRTEYEEYLEERNINSYLFSLGRTEYERYLEEGTIDENLTEAFNDEGYDVVDDANLSEEGGEWFVSQNDKREYRIEKEKEELTIYDNVWKEAFVEKGRDIEKNSTLRKEDQKWFIFENEEKEYMIEVGEEVLNIYEEKPTITVNGEKYETYKLNINITATAGSSGDWTLGRFEYYYSPEVKNTVLTRLYETKKNPDTKELEERHSGDEKLLDYELQEGSVGDKDKNGERLILTNPMFLVIVGIVVGTAVIYLYMKGKRETES